jgi:N6-adenosine-specific RNA methylase IME4
MNVPAVHEQEITPLAREWADKIGASWRDTVTSIIATGELIAAAKADPDLPHGQFVAMITLCTPFNVSTAQRLMKIAADERVRTYLPQLPPVWTTLYEITKLDDETFEVYVADGTINSGMSNNRAIATALKKEKRAKRERALAQKILALPETKYGLILADPPWRFKPYSRETGLDRSPDNHYPTENTQAIASWDICHKIAFDDCVLALWATAPQMKDALWVMERWGFEYQTELVWYKKTANGEPATGTGYWFRNCHEKLLIGTRGNPPAPAPGDQWLSVTEATRGEHSQKPDAAYEMLEGYFPNLPKLEMNARRARPGWDPWGLEAPPTAPQPPPVKAFDSPHEGEAIPDFLRREPAPAVGGGDESNSGAACFAWRAAQEIGQRSAQG